MSRFELRGSSADLESAVAHAARAVADTPQGDPDRAMYWSNLAGALHTRFEYRHDLSDLEASVMAACAAVEMTASGTVNGPGFRSSLAGFLRSRYDISGNPDDLDEAVRIGENAISVTDTAHPERSGFLTNLAVAYWRRYESDGSASDAQRAVVAWKEAAAARTPPVMMRLVAARTWATSLAVRAWDNVSHAGGDGFAAQANAADGYAAAVELLPLAAWHGLDRLDVERVLADHSGLTGDAAATWVTNGDCARAVVLLESGRGIIWGRLLDRQHDLDDLEASAPELARRMRQLRRLLDRPVIAAAQWR